MNREKCPMDSYVIVPEKCSYIDQQVLKIQETPELIPTGEIPRSYLVTCDRNLVDLVTPGSRVRITGIFTTVNKRPEQEKKGNGAIAIKMSYVRALAIEVEKGATGKFVPHLSIEEEEKFIKYSKDPLIYDKISKSIGSAIYGHQEIKKAIACLLFGGSSKRLPDGMKLRGDINVLLLGDPSTAKSQFLKFVERVAPISIYTSGKGSSAAGLTASVIKDATTGEFQLEGGAMVLADGGVVCIDEFDKMRVQDRVAIHEAMEQQTISVAKAGITTILNSRASVLAAANPLSGRYDDLKEAADQIDFQTTILSRFDCIFIVRDIRNDAVDMKLANHVISLHMGAVVEEEQKGEIDMEDLKKYIAYAKVKCAPRLTEDAGIALQNFYVNDRKASGDKRKTSKSINIKYL